MKKHGHYCKVCGEYKANEKFSGKGHAAHICKSCASLSPEKQAEQMTVNRLLNLPWRLSKEQISWLKNRMKDKRPEVRALAKEQYEMRFPPKRLEDIGGKELSEENAAQTAKALNIIQPDFIRVHATGIKLESKLGEFVRDGSFTLQSEEEIVIEQKLFLQQLHEMDSYYVNEHIVNLLLEVRGNLRTEKQEMLSTIDRFLTLPPDERLLFTVGRRLNIFFRLDDLKKPKLHQKAGESLQQILSKNPHVDFAALCNYVRQSQI